jgi:hypothetical protein
MASGVGRAASSVVAVALLALGCKKRVDASTVADPPPPTFVDPPATAPPSAARASATATQSVTPPEKADPAVCQRARLARARQSPAAPRLEAQCRAEGGGL